MSDAPSTHPGSDPDAGRDWLAGLGAPEAWEEMRRLVVVLARPTDETPAVTGLMAAAARHPIDVDVVVAAQETELAEALRAVVGPDGDGIWLACPAGRDGGDDGDDAHDDVARVVSRLAADVGACLLQFEVPGADPEDPARASAAPFRLTRPEPVTGPMDRVHTGEDPWGVDERFYERRKRALTLASLPRERWGRALEIGCSVGALAQDLATRCDEVLGVDISEQAVATATRRLADVPGASARRLRVPRHWPEGRWDLVVVSETGYYLTSRELDRLLDRVDASLADDGAVVLCHWLHPIEGWFLQGIDVHDRFAADPRFEVLATHREPDFALDVLRRPGQPSVAQAEGIV